MSAASLVLGMIGTELVGPVVVELGTRAVRSLMQGAAVDGGGQLPTLATLADPPLAGERFRLAIPGLRKAPQRAQMVEQLALAVPGVSCARANVVSGRLLVVYDPAVVTPAVIAATLGQSLESISAA